MRRLITLLILFHCNLILAFAQGCPAGSTAIYFGNGVDNTSVEAHSSSDKLKQLIMSQLSPPSPQHSIDPSCVTFSLAYDSKFFFQNKSSNPLTTFNTLFQFLQKAVQLTQSAVQLTQQDLSQLWLWLLDPINAPSWFNQIVLEAILNADIISQPDLELQIQKYSFDLSNHAKIVVVAHSQGNFYANQAYEQLLPANGQFSLVSVATPANNVLGADAPYVTLDQDPIQLVPGSLAWNTSNGATPKVCSSSAALFGNCSFSAHDFSYSYLLVGVASRAKIFNDVIDNIPIVLGVSTGGTGNGSVSSSPSGISCSSPCNAVQAAFPNGTSVTLTASADSLSTFSGWQGDCAAVATAGGGNSRTITFPLAYDPTGKVVSQYPENCTARFVSQSQSYWTGTYIFGGMIPPQTTPADFCLIGSGQQNTGWLRILPGGSDYVVEFTGGGTYADGQFILSGYESVPYSPYLTVQLSGSYGATAIKATIRYSSQGIADQTVLNYAGAHCPSLN